MKKTNPENKKSRSAGSCGLKLLYPPRCPICDGLMDFRKRGCCDGCAGKLPWVSGAKCMKCGRPLTNPQAEYCSDCAGGRRYFDGGAAAFTYSGEMRDSVARMKFQNRRDYLPFYGEAMGRALAGRLRLWRPKAILPVPMHPKKRRRRGFNQAELLAGELARFTGIPLKNDILKCVRLTEDQKKLDRRARQRNLRGIFSVEGDISDLGSVLLVDDVFTTGSTVDELARVLKRHGMERVYFAVLCIGKEKDGCTEPKLCYTMEKGKESVE